MDNWRKSSFSSANGGSCVEVANGDGVMVRDTTDRDGGTLAFSAEVWQAFAGSLKLAGPRDELRKPTTSG
jgi:hypothetical protein